MVLSVNNFFGSINDYVDDSKRKMIASSQMTIYDVPIITYAFISITCLVLSYVTIWITRVIHNRNIRQY